MYGDATLDVNTFSKWIHHSNGAEGQTSMSDEKQNGRLTTPVIRCNI